MVVLTGFHCTNIERNWQSKNLAILIKKKCYMLSQFVFCPSCEEKKFYPLCLPLVFVKIINVFSCHSTCTCMSANQAEFDNFYFDGAGLVGLVKLHCKIRSFDLDVGNESIGGWDSLWHYQDWLPCQEQREICKETAEVGWSQWSNTQGLSVAENLHYMHMQEWHMNKLNEICNN